MQLQHILIFTGAILVVSALGNNRVRDYFILIGSVVALFWLQPGTAIRNLDFYLPFIILAFTLLVWLASRSSSPFTALKENRWTLALIGITVLGIGLLRYVQPLCCLTASRPPQIWRIAVAFVIASSLSLIIGLGAKKAYARIILLLVFLTILIVLKAPPLTTSASRLLRALSQQSVDQVSALDIQWLGISYVIFRLAHTIFEFRQGRLPEVSLLEFFNYIIFFPTLVAGPIDRLDHFVADYRQADYRLSWTTLYVGGRRIVLGLFKKFVISDSLALLVLNRSTIDAAQSSGWLWLLLYAYLFRIFLDFSGYVDIAVGLGRLLGIEVPENFDRPLRKSNLTTFWNSWHITLATWFRAYYFHPVSRAMLRRWKRIPMAAIIAFCQVTTMVLIGLWHSITLNFLLWGLMHGLGLFIHNRWVAFTRNRLAWIQERRVLKAAVTAASTALTIQFFAVSLVWLAVPDFPTAATVLTRLFFLE